MKVTILGSGTYQPELDRHCSSYLIETEKSKICFDFGRGAIEQLLKIGISTTEIEAIFISHWHADHIADLLSLLHITIAAPADITVDWIPRQKQLKIFGPKDTRKQLDYLKRAALLDNRPMDMIKVNEIQGKDIKSVDWMVKSYITKHNPEIVALCYRLESNGKIFAYSGDTAESEGLKKAIQNADLAVIEAGWPEEIKPKTHLTGERAGKIAQEQKVKKLVLTHCSPYYLKNGNPVKDAQKYFRGKVVLARDLMKFKI